MTHPTFGNTEINEIIDNSRRIVFFGGAGMSTESGIPGFRSADGLYNAKTKYGTSPEEMISHSYFVKHMDNFLEYYKHNMIFPDAKPNRGHLALAKLEQKGKLSRIVTQNIDGLRENLRS